MNRKGTTFTILSIALGLGAVAEPSGATTCEQYDQYVHRIGFTQPPVTQLDGVAVQGTWAYVSVAQLGVQVVDLSDPRNPTAVLTVPVGGTAYGLTTVGDYLYVAVGSSGISIVDIQDPEAAAVVGSADTNGLATGIDVVGNLAYVADGSVELQIIDVSDPADPKLEGDYDAAGASFAESVHVDGDHAYVASAAGLFIINIENPENPFEVASRSELASSHDVVVRGTQAYVIGTGSSELTVVDVSNPALPVIGVQLPVTGTGIDIIGDTLVVSTARGCRMFDLLNDPQVPVETGSVGLGIAFFGGKLAVGNGIVLDVRGQQGLSVVAVPSPFSVPTLGFDDMTASDVRGVAVEGTTAVVAGGDGIYTFDVSDPENPIGLDYFGPSFDYRGVTLIEGYAYMANGFAGVTVFNIQNAMDIQEILTIDTATPYSIIPAGDHAYVADGNGGLVVLDTSSPSAPSEGAAIATLGSARNGVVSDGYLYLAVGQAGLQVFDLSQPAAPNSIGSIDTLDEAVDVAVVGSFAYVADSEDGVQIFDVNDPSNPMPAGAIPIPSITTSVNAAVNSSLLYVTAQSAASGPGVLLFDITDPFAPLAVGSIDTPGRAWSAVRYRPNPNESGRLYVADGEGGLRIMPLDCEDIVVSVFVSGFRVARDDEGYRVSWEVAGELRGEFRLTVSWGDETDELAVVDHGGGQFSSFLSSGNRQWETAVVRLEHRARSGNWTVVATQLVEATLPRLGPGLVDVYPNPFNPRTTIDFEVYRREHVQLGVYDARGRLVATLIDELIDPGSHSVNWSGQDSEGRSLASGVYHVRFSTADEVDTRAVALIR